MKRRINTIICSLVLIISLLSVNAFATDGFINVYSTNIRSGAGQSYSIVHSLSNETRLQGNNDSWCNDKDYWSAVRYSSYSGYVRNDLICPAQSCYKVVTNSTVNFRTAPSTTTGTIITSLTNGTYLHVISQSGGWAYAQVFTSNSYDGRYGYISTTYLTQVFGHL